jgi:basic membrane protein A
VIEGTWESKDIWWGLKEGLVDLAPYGDDVTDETKAIVEAERARIISGEWDVFTGPLKNQGGDVVVAEGEKMSDGDMLGMNWFVQGVEGQIPD